jgi:hypothetical protein
MKKIKACPFCGKAPELKLQSDGYYHIRCINADCPGKFKASLKPSDVISAWNTRLKPEKPAT